VTRRWFRQKTISDEHFAIDPDKVGRRRSSTASSCCGLNPLEAMLCYKQLLTVEQTQGPVLDPPDLPQARRDRPWPCSFLALVLKR
jgi:hypothetical protein